MSDFKERSYAGEKLRNTYPNCYYCGAPVDSYDAVYDNLKTVDHVQPKKDKGILSKKNKVVSCSKCNSMKGNMTPEEFMTFLHRYRTTLKRNYRAENAYITRVIANTKNLISKKRING